MSVGEKKIWFAYDRRAGLYRTMIRGGGVGKGGGVGVGLKRMKNLNFSIWVRGDPRKKPVELKRHSGKEFLIRKQR